MTDNTKKTKYVPMSVADQHKHQSVLLPSGRWLQSTHPDWVRYQEHIADMRRTGGVRADKVIEQVRASMVKKKRGSGGKGPGITIEPRNVTGVN